MKPLELYIHIPFCIQKCKYCDFLSAPSTREERQAYVNSLCQRIRSFKDLAKAYCVVSIFVGGGTPSVLEAEQMAAVFEAVRETFWVEESAEVTVEVNPGTVSKEKLWLYRKVGVNRLSIGLQSTEEKDLRRLGRIHTFQDFRDTYALAREEGFQNVNIDVMSGIPFQTLEGWEKTLTKVACMQPEHISAYSLIIEEGTPFYEWYEDEEWGEKRRETELPGEETERQMYSRTKDILQKFGYHRYEISNYAREGYECRHNIGYWKRTEYLGIGSGAASLINNCRWNEGEEPKRLGTEQQMEEYMFLGLRMMEGIHKEEFRKEFGVTVEEIYGGVLQKLYGTGLLKESGPYIRLTERGIDVSNYVMSEFLFD